MQKYYGSVKTSRMFACTYGGVYNHVHIEEIEEVYLKEHIIPGTYGDRMNNSILQYILKGLLYRKTALWNIKDDGWRGDTFLKSPHSGFPEW